MAENNSVPLGQAGTGAAFRLGENRALPLFQRDVALQQQRRDEEAQNLAKSYKDNMLAASGGQLFANELGQLEQKHIQKGYEYRANGIDVYNPNPNDPNQLKAAQDYMTERREIENLRAYRKGIEDDFKRGITDLAKATEGEYDSGIINERNKIVTEGSLQDLYKRGASLPQLQKKFNLADEFKGIKAPTIATEKNVNGIIETDQYVDKKSAENLVFSTLANSGQGRAALLKATGGIEPSEVRSFPDSLSGIEATLKENYYGDPRLTEQLAANQIKIGSPKFQELVDKEAKAILQAKRGLNTLVNDGVNQISQGVKVIDKSKPEISAYQKAQLQNKEEDQVLARQRLALSRERANKVGSKAEDKALYRQQLVDGMLTGVPGTGEEIGAIMQAKGGYTKPLVINTSDPSKIVITVPERIISKTKQTKDGKIESTSNIEDPKTLTFTRNKAEDRIKLNQLISDVTGENISLSKFRSGNASGKVTKAPAKAPTKTTTTKPIPKFKGVPKGGF